MIFMYWLKRVTHRLKHEKDRKHVFLWHVSPIRLTNLSPRSRLGNKIGLYFSSSFASIIDDWVPYVAGKKNKNHDLESRWREMCKERERIEGLPDYPDKQKDLECIETESQEILESRRKGGYDSTLQDYYKTIFLTKVICPEWVLEDSHKFMHDVFEDQESRGVASIGFWGWGVQTFIPAEFFPSLRIVFSKPYNYYELLRKFDYAKKPRK